MYVCVYVYVYIQHIYVGANGPGTHDASIATPERLYGQWLKEAEAPPYIHKLRSNSAACTVQRAGKQ